MTKKSRRVLDRWDVIILFGETDKEEAKEAARKIAKKTGYIVRIIRNIRNMDAENTESV